MNLRRMLIAVLLWLVSACAPTENGLVVTDAWVRTTAADGTSAAYMTIENRSGTTERLIRASSAAADVTMLHQTVIENDVARMDHLTGVDIPAGQSLSLAPIGYHLMLMGLRRELVIGERVAITLEFDSGKTITVEAEVRPLFEGGS